MGDAALEFRPVAADDFAEQVDAGAGDIGVRSRIFSHDTSVIMATMVEVAQRMLTKRPTVARTSESGIWLVDRSPTRAREPRTEITRPKDVTAINLACHEMDSAPLCDGCRCTNG